MFANLLVPVDGSEGAHKAVVVAGDLATRYGARITVLHVLKRVGTAIVPDELEPYLRAEHVRMTESDFLRRGTEEIVERETRYLRQTGLRNVEAGIDVGDPARVIVERAKRDGVDLIVIGSRGRSDIAALLLGSVSHKVANLAPCSCITVR